MYVVENCYSYSYHNYYYNYQYYYTRLIAVSRLT